MSAAPKKRGRGRWIALIALLAIVLLVALAPTLLSLGPARAIVAKQVQANVDGTVTVDGVALSWFGGQSVRGLHVTNRAGTPVANLDATVDAGLIALLTGGADPLAVTLSGDMTIDVAADGATSIDDLVAPSSAPGPSLPATAPSTAPRIDVTLDAFDLMLGLPDASPVALTNLRGDVHVVPGGLTTAALEGAIAQGGAQGAVTLEAKTGLVGADGGLAPKGAALDAVLQVLGPEVTITDDVDRIERLALSLSSANVAESVEVTVEFEPRLAGGDLARLDGDLTLRSPMRADGAVQVGLDAIDGTVKGTGVPSALLQPFLGTDTIDLVRDVGPMLAITATAEPPAGSAARRFDLIVRGAHASLTATGAVDGRVVRGEHAEFRATVAPDRASALTGLVVAQPIALELDVDDLALGLGDDGGVDLEATTGTAVLRLAAPIDAAKAEGAPALSLADVVVTVTKGAETTVRGAGVLAGEPFTTEGTLQWTGNAPSGATLVTALRATPALVAALEPDEAWPSLVEPAPLRIETTTTRDGDGWAHAITAQGRVVLAHERLTEPVTVDVTEAGTTVRAGALGPVTAKATVEGIAAFEVERSPGGTTSVLAKAIAIGALEARLGLDPATISTWTGPSGDCHVQVGRSLLKIRPIFAALSGAVDATIDDDLVHVDLGMLRTTVAAAQVAAWLAPSEPESVVIDEDVPVTLTLTGSTLPLALLRGEPIDTARTVVHGSVSIDALPAVIDGTSAGLRAIGIALDATDLTERVDVRMSAERIGAEGSLRINGRITSVLDDEQRLAPKLARFTGTIKADGIPTALVDGRLGLRGYLEDAVGPSLSLDANAQTLTTIDGNVGGTIEAPTGNLRIQLHPRDGRLVVGDAPPMAASLQPTPALRTRLLARVHPLFADVRNTERPIRAAVATGFRVPTNGDTRQLEGDLTIDVGAVEIAAGSSILGILAIFDTSPRETVPAYIEPINVHVRKGIITYDRFAVRVDPYVLVYSGSIDLPNQRIDLRTKIPLDALGESFKELKGYVEGITVPIVTRGTFDSYKTELDPEFDVGGLLLQGGVNALLKELFDK